MDFTLRDVFGTRTIADYVRSFDFSTIDPTDKQKNDHLVVKFAPCYGTSQTTLDVAAVQTFDEYEKIALLAVIKSIKKLGKDKVDWDNILASMTENTFLEPEGDPISSADSRIKESSKQPIDLLKSFTEDDSQKLLVTPDEVYSFLKKLTKDEKVLQTAGFEVGGAATGIANLLNRMVKEPSILEQILSLGTRKEQYVKPVLDIIVLELPNSVKRSQFTLYDLKLTAVSTTDLFAGFGTKRHGITGEFRCRNYKPRKEYIDNLQEDTKKQALEQLSAIIKA